MALSTGLVLYWKLDETSGTSAADASGNGNAGTLVGNAAFNSGGKLNYGVAMDGNGDRVDGPTRTPPAAYSMSIWAKQTATGGFKILGHQQDSNMFTYCFVDSSNAVVNYVYETNNSTRIGRSTAANGFPTNLGWHHVVVTWSGGVGATSIKIYVDGTQVDANSLTTGTFANRQTNACKLCIGDRPSVASTNSWNGVQDEVGFWDRELTQSEVTALYNAGSPLPFPWDEVLTAATTAFALTGTSSTGLLYGPSLPSASNAFALSGTAAMLVHGYPLTSGIGAFVEASTNIRLRHKVPIKQTHARCSLGI